MLTFTTITAIRAFLAKVSDNRQQKTIGFVPTMGALHEGHLELMRRAKQENDLLVVSIFVNPIQFNNKEDLEKYPRMPETDSALLSSVGCDVLFAPGVSEMYPEPDKQLYDFGLLAGVMEGKSRPGHFNGVAIVVRKLFEIIEPHKAYFGEKDFQQLAIIQQLVKMLKMPVDIIPCRIVREADGLAMSSRNMRLSIEERAVAPSIYDTLKKAVDIAAQHTPASLKQWVMEEFTKQPLFSPEYVEIAEDRLLQPVISWNSSVGTMMFVAVFLGKVRLIDNIRIF
ncbi:MAG: pantoate--beta-alanine ligase [Bacteroidales bacterium]|nr:pantoate--beta-alanine ligase [Bacteroidales bacterium]